MKIVNFFVAKLKRHTQRFKNPMQKFGVATLTILVTLLSIGGMSLFDVFDEVTPVAEAAYSGKHMRTVEYVLGGGAGTGVSQSGTDNFGTARASDANIYAGSAWNATKGTAGTKTVAIEGSGIRVVSAFLNVTAVTVTAVSVTNLELTLDVSPGVNAGGDVNVSSVASNGTGLIFTQTSSLSSPILTAKADATALFQSQTDGEWNSGLSVVGMMSVKGPTWTNATMKLTITYEQDYSTVGHTELKTVRFPLTSTTTGDNGTKRSDCASGTTCSLQYALDIPDLAANADILDVWFEISYVDNGATPATTTIGIAGGGSVGVNAHEALTDGMERFVIYRPPVGSPDLLPNVSQKIDVAVLANAVGGLGGEVVVTYKFETDASVQAETVQYWVGQGTALPGTASTSFTQLATISNGTADVRNLWYKVHTSVTNTPGMNITTKVGASASTTKRYNPTFSSPRGGALHIIQDVGSATTSFTFPSTLLSSDVRFEATTYDAVPAVEAYITFHWDGSAGGTMTKSVKYFAGASGSVVATGNQATSLPFTVTLGETVEKTLRSSYLSTSILHTNTGTIANGTLIFTLSGQDSVTINEATEDTENFRAQYLTRATEGGFTFDNQILWTARDFRITVQSNQSNEIGVSSEMVVTYDADLAVDAPDTGEGKHLRTVEFALGGGAGTSITQTGTDAGASARASDANIYAGSAWNATKGTAGTKTVAIEGSGIRVVSAYLDATAGIVTATDVTNLEFAVDVSPGPSGGTDVYVDEIGQNGATQIYIDTSGASSPILSAKADVTALFQTQTDAEWNSGVAVVGLMSVTGPTWINATMKLVITYEENYSLVPHDAVKTVRFPLRSTTAGDSGTKRADCTAGSTCSFTYEATIPDMATTSDILDVWYEMSYVDNTAASVTLSKNGGATGVAHVPLEVLTDGMERFLIYRPAIGGANFATGTGQVDVAVATSNIGAIGGELVITYKYNTGATRQVETVQYFMGQATALPGTASTTFTRMATIANGSSTVRHIWYKIHDSVTTVTTNSTAIGGKVGASATTTVTYTPTLTNARGGELRIIHDMGSATSSWTASSTLLSMDIRHNAATYDGPPGVEAFITYEWEGHLNGPVTKTAKFFAGSSGAVPALANTDNSLPFEVTLPETVTKTLRSSYLSTSVLHTDNTTKAAGTVRISFSESNPITITEGTEDTENFRAIYLSEATSTNYIVDNTIPWTSRFFQAIVRGNQTEEYAVSSELVVTYNADLRLKTPVFDQNYYRFYADNDALLPTDPWPLGAANLNENANITPIDLPPDQGDRFRLRMSFGVATTTLLASTTAFKLQYGAPTSTCGNLGGTWVDVGGIGSGALWRGYNTSATDETNLSVNPPSPSTDLVLAQSDRAGSFEEVNNSRTNPFAVFVGEDVEYDWVVEDNLAATNTEYCFRMAYADGTAFTTYTDYPIVKTAGYSPETRNWRFYDDENNETPTTPLANENVAPVNVKYGDIQKLRITVADTRGHNGVNQKFQLQYSTYSDFSAQTFFVDAIPDCAGIWCYANGVDTDDSAVTSLLLTDSAFAGRHNESTTSASTIDPLANNAYEFEYTFKHNGASANTTYFFRLWDVNNDVPVLLDGGGSYPSLSTGDTTLTFEIAGTPVASSTEGILTTIATTPTSVPFGDLLVDTPVIGAHILTVTTNAISGYQVFVRESQDFVSAGGAEITGFNASNTTPLPWATGCTVSMHGCFGYHAGDDTLFGGDARFSANDTWAEFEIPTREVMFAAGPVASDTADMIYRVDRHTLLPAGQYETQIQYIVVPTY